MPANLTALSEAQAVFDELCNDPQVWATHGKPSGVKEERIVSAIAKAILAARRK